MFPPHQELTLSVSGSLNPGIEGRAFGFQAEVKAPNSVEPRALTGLIVDVFFLETVFCWNCCWICKNCFTLMFVGMFGCCWCFLFSFLSFVVVFCLLLCLLLPFSFILMILFLFLFLCCCFFLLFKRFAGHWSILLLVIGIVYIASLVSQPLALVSLYADDVAF